jgi:hypothetical protein
MFWNAKFQVVDVVAKLELAKANVGDVVQLQSPAAKILKRALDDFFLKRFLDKRYPLTRKSFPQQLWPKLAPKLELQKFIRDCQEIVLTPSTSMYSDVDVKLMKMAIQSEGCLVSSDFVTSCD